MRPLRRAIALLACCSAVIACGRDAPARVDTAVAAAPPAGRPEPPICGDTSEAEALAACGRGRVRRAGDTLVLVVAAGRVAPVKIADDPTDGEQYARFRFAGTVLGGRYYVIDANGYESVWTELVDAESGERVSLTGAPVPSPDGAHIAAAARDFEIAEGATRLELWRVQTGKPVLALALQPYDERYETDSGWGPGDVGWRGPDTLVVPRYFPAPTVRPAGEVLRDTALVVRAGGEWRLVTRDSTRDSTTR